MAHSCGKKGCKCARGRKYWHINWYISQSRNGKQRMKYVPWEYVKTMKIKTKTYKEARDLLKVIGDEYWDMFSNKQKM
jgi:hypothetical protein